MNRKGDIMDLFVWIIVSFVILIFFAVWMFGMNLITVELIAVETPSNIVNVSEAATNTFGQMNTALNSLRFMAFAIIVTLGFGILIGNFMVKAHPVLFIVYIFITIIAVIFSVSISNAYEGLLSNTTIGATLLTFKAGGFIMLHLPTWVTVIGLIGAVILLVGIVRDRQLGGEVI